MTFPSPWKWNARWTISEPLSKEAYDWLIDVHAETHTPPSVLVVNLPATAIPGTMRFVTNGRKVSEGAGAGTGTTAVWDGTAWRRVADDTTVAA